MTWTAGVLLGLVVLGLVAGGVALYRHVKPAIHDDEPVPERGDGSAVEELEGFQRRIITWVGTFMRRVAVSLIVLGALILASLAINVVLWGQQRADDRAGEAQTATNTRVLRELEANRKRAAADLKDRRDRAAATDRQQCEDIEKLKADARRGAREGRKTIKALRGLPKDDVDRLLESSKRSEKRFAPRIVTTKDGRTLKGLAACGALPNAGG